MLQNGKLDLKEDLFLESEQLNNYGLKFRPILLISQLKEQIPICNGLEQLF